VHARAVWCLDVRGRSGHDGHAAYALRWSLALRRGRCERRKVGGRAELRGAARVCTNIGGCTRRTFGSRRGSGNRNSGCCGSGGCSGILRGSGRSRRGMRG
jgi:hypothetical protein